MIKIKKLIPFLILFFLSTSLHAASVVSDLVYTMFDHPDGALTSPTIDYGLRVDSLASLSGGDGSNEAATFSTQSTFGSYHYWDSASSTSFLFGDLTRNSDSSNWQVFYTSFNTTGNMDGYTSATGIGLLTNGSDTYILTGKQNSSGDAFIAQGDGHRCGSVDCLRAPDDSWQEVARGWLYVFSSPLGDVSEYLLFDEVLAALLGGTYADEAVDYLSGLADELKYFLRGCKYEYKCRDITRNTNDWLVQLQPVPIPAALPMLLSGLLGFSVFSRRRKAA